MQQAHTCATNKQQDEHFPLIGTQCNGLMLLSISLAPSNPRYYYQVGWTPATLILVIFLVHFRLVSLSSIKVRVTTFSLFQRIYFTGFFL